MGSEEIACEKNTTSKRSHVATVVNQITGVLAGKLSWNKARLDCFALFIASVLLQRTVNLVLLSVCSHRKGQTLSAYRRFQRFLSGFDLPMPDVGKFILGLLPKPKEGFVLTMDRCVWQFGSTPINLLFIGVVLGKMCFPIAWCSLPKRTDYGCSNPSSRMRVLEAALQVLGGRQVRVLLMDREFGGKRWLGHLDKRGVAYVVRVKSNIWIGTRKADWLGRGSRWKKHRHERFKVCDQDVYFAGKSIASQRASRLLVISNRFRGVEALELYRLRWGIELFFAHLKSRGLNFEDTHLRTGKRIERLCAVLAVAFVIAYRNGVRVQASVGCVLKKHGYRAKSLFRSGLEQIIRAFISEDLRLLARIFSSLPAALPWKHI